MELLNQMSDAEDLPLKLKVMMALGMAKVKKTKQTSSGTMPKGFGSAAPRPRRKSPISMSRLIAIFIIIIPVLAAIPIFSGGANNNEEEPLRERARVVADREAKDKWEEKEWENPATVLRLQELKTEIDNADCNQLEDFFKHEQWTLRAYVAHTILEEGC